MLLKRAVPMVAVLLFCSVLAAGCGDDDTAATSTHAATSSTSAAPSTTTPAPTTQAPATTTTASPTTTEASATTQAAPSSGDLIAFSRSMPDGSLEVFTIDPETGATTQVTDGFGTALMPVWSQDRSLLAFWSMDTGEEYIWTIASDGSNLTQATDFSSAVPDWWRGDEVSSSGEYLVFNSDSAGEPADVPDIYLMPLGVPTGLVQLVDSDATLDYRPRISHDGNQLLFVSDRDGTADLWVLNGPTGELTNLTGAMGGYEMSGDWAPDGSAIAFVSVAADPDIWVMGADGSNPRLLVGGPGSQDSPSWSPDGTRIVYTSDAGGMPALWIIDADGGNPTQLTSGATSDLWPDWW